MTEKTRPPKFIRSSKRAGKGFRNSMTEDDDRRRSLALRAAGWLGIPLCYALMLSIVITAARRPVAGR